MQFIHCEIYQGAIAAVHLEFPTQELYGVSETLPSKRVISPVVIDQIGTISLLPPVSTVDKAIAIAKAQIERDNKSYVNHLMQDDVPAQNAVQHIEDCGIPTELVPRLAVEQSYSPKNYP
ncbi:MAG: hypothetical protein AAFQ89_04775 [Cyanobacteria bacterium J06626_18]